MKKYSEKWWKLQGIEVSDFKTPQLYYHKDEDDRDLDDNNKALALCESRMKRQIKWEP